MIIKIETISFRKSQIAVKGEAYFYRPGRNFSFQSVFEVLDFQSKKGNVVTERSGQIKIRHKDEEIRFEQDSFPLYSSEKLYEKVSLLQVLLLILRSD